MKKILVIGTGSIAERHIENILKLNQEININVLSQNKNRAKNFIKKFKNKNITLISNLYLKKKVVEEKIH